MVIIFTQNVLLMIIGIYALKNKKKILKSWKALKKYMVTENIGKKYTVPVP
jgi:hypothetical protein